MKGIGLSMHLQLMKYLGYMVTMATIMFVTPFQLNILKHNRHSQWVSSHLSILAFFRGDDVDARLVSVCKDLNEISLLFILTVCVTLALGYPIIYALLYQYQLRNENGNWSASSYCLCLTNYSLPKGMTPSPTTITQSVLHQLSTEYNVRDISYVLPIYDLTCQEREKLII
jgi:hypothetical protein